MSQWVQSQAADFYDRGYNSWSHGMTNVSIPEVTMLKNISIFSPINIYSKLVFFSINGPRETYFLGELRSNLHKRVIGCNRYQFKHLIAEEGKVCHSYFLVLLLHFT